MTQQPAPSRTLIRSMKLVLLACALLAVGLFFFFHLDSYLSLSSLKEATWIRESYNQHPVETLLAYFIIAYVYVVCSLPAAMIIMILSGALFGTVLGGSLCLLAVNLGAVTSLLLSRFVFRDFVRRQFGKQVAVVEREYERSGATYLVAMRLIPLLPYFVTNLVFGLTSMKPFKFLVLSTLSSAPAVFIYANAGREISKINSFSEILTPRLAAAFIALAALPFLGQIVTPKVLRVRPPPTDFTDRNT